MSRRKLWSDDDRIFRAPPVKRAMSGDRWVIVWLILAVVFWAGLWESVQWLSRLLGKQQ